MQRKTKIRVDSLSSLMGYILGHRPDEFGVLPEENGFLTYKELLWAIHEEPGWGYVKQGHIKEVLLGKDRTLYDWDDQLIRAKERHWLLDLSLPSPSVPKILFICIRRRAYPHVKEYGLSSINPMILTPDKEMALRLGRRKDQNPVLLEVSTTLAKGQRVLFYAFGDLFLAREIPAGLISGPPLPKERREAGEKGDKKGDKPMPASALPEPGTFLLNPRRDPDLHRRMQGKKQKGWKEEARKFRKRREDD